MITDDAKTAEIVEALKAHLTKDGRPLTFEPPRPDAQAPSGPAADKAAAARAGYLARVADARTSAGLLNAPLAGRAALLERPIWWKLYQGDNSPLLVDVTIAPGDTRVRLQHKSNHRGTHDYVQVYYFWRNDTGQTALVDFFAPVILTGHMNARAAGTFLGGATTYTQLEIIMHLRRNTGWGADDGKQISIPLADWDMVQPFFSSTGRSFYRSGPNRGKTFMYDPGHVGQKSMIVPSGASIYIEIWIRAYCHVPSSALDNNTTLEFYDGDNGIRLPYVLVAARN